LLGFERIELAPGESRTVTVAADPRLLARYDTEAGEWRGAGGTHRGALGRAADDLVLAAEVQLSERRFGRCPALPAGRRRRAPRGRRPRCGSAWPRDRRP